MLVVRVAKPAVARFAGRGKKGLLAIMRLTTSLIFVLQPGEQREVIAMRLEQVQIGSRLVIDPRSFRPQVWRVQTKRGELS